MNKKLIAIFVLGFAILGTHAVAASHGSDGTVKDKNTHLVWQQETSDALSWADAKTYCDNLVFARKNDWRLPSQNELNTIVDYGRSPAASLLFSFKIDPVSGYSYSWSSTPSIANDSRAFATEFITAGTATYFKGETLYARCVRR